MSRLRRIARTLERTYKQRGVVGSVKHFSKVAVQRIRGEGGSGTTAGIELDAPEDAEFDAKYGVDTGGQIPQVDLDVKTDTWVHGSAYVATSPVDFSYVLRDLDVDYSKATFIDLGCGKGRVLFMAAALPWKRVVGVEFSPTLADVARSNIGKYTGPKTCKDIVVETEDATKYRYPEGDLCLFFYDPFDDKIMKPVVENLLRAMKESSRRVLVVYFKPEQRHNFDQAREFANVRNELPLFAVWDTRKN